MSVITVTFYDGETGGAAQPPADFQLRVFPPNSDQQQDVKIVSSLDQKLVAVVEAGIYTVHFSTEEKIVSLYPEEPCDISMLVLEGEDGRANFDIYLWNIDPNKETEVPDPLKATCLYCDNRYTTPTSPYYRNTTWYNNCYTNPPCT